MSQSRVLKSKISPPRPHKTGGETPISIENQSTGTNPKGERLTAKFILQQKPKEHKHKNPRLDKSWVL